MKPICFKLFYFISSACVRKTKPVGGTDPGKCCVFPFIYNGKNYTDCIASLDRYGEWCATVAVYNKDKWGRCEPSKGKILICYGK